MMALTNKRLFISLFLICAIAIVFWSESRIPALNEKAQMGLRTNFGELAFEIVLPVTEEQSSLERIARTSVNWAYTNLQGMIFGLLFAAAALTVMGTLRARSFKRPWQNTALGVLVGTPLGVCVNCATPIALGIYSAGARLETTLASLASSPTLNIIVLTMSFTLLPLEMALAKFFGVVFFLACIPLLIKLSVDNTKAGLTAESIPDSLIRLPDKCAMPAANINSENLNQALYGTFVNYRDNLFYITKLAVPLMILAGIMGAIVIEVVPFSVLEAADAGLLGILLAAVIATLLPVPIAFDVIIVMALLAGGIDKGVAMALLFGLGIYSIYPASVIARFISVRLSLYIFFLVICIALMLGVWAKHHYQAAAVEENTLITEGLNRSSIEVYGDAMAVCESLPQDLGKICFKQHMDKLNDVVSTEQLCGRPSSLFSQESCNSIVDTYVIRQQALESADPTYCDNLSDMREKQRCSLDVIQEIAVTDHDIDSCNHSRLGAQAVAACRNHYLNENLLFNPDGSVCKGLSDQELNDCKINAEIYLYTDAVNIQGCDNIAITSAREHCRYTVASVMIGRYGDVSGCSLIENTDLQQRCKKQALSWQIVREGDLNNCTAIDDTYFQNICSLRIANNHINKILYSYSASSLEVLLKQYTVEKDVHGQQQVSRSSAPVLTQSLIGKTDELEVVFIPYQESISTWQDKFEKYPASELGITFGWNFRMMDFFEPFIIGKGIASGDFNDDYWPDIALASERGVKLYRNIGGRFEYVPLERNEMQQANLFLVAFVDIDNDGRQDLFASSYAGKNFILKNKDGNFTDTELVELTGEHRLTIAAGFGDLNQNGRLDIVLGNWSSGVEKLFAPEQSQNVVLFNEAEGFRSKALKNAKGETNSILLSDINNDHKTDILIGNDRMVPDYYLINRDDGKFTPITNDSNMVDTTSMFTMSIDTADFNNDLQIDIFSTDMTFARTSYKDYCAAVQNTAQQTECNRLLEAYDSFNEANPSYCESLSESDQKADCYAAFAIRSAKTIKDPAICDYLPKQDAASIALCRYLAKESITAESIDHTKHLPQSQRNVLLINEQDTYRDYATELGVSSSFWSWNAKAADLDNDGWQDIYVGNGFHFGDSFFEIQDNIVFKNMSGEGFIEKHAEWGLDDRLNTPSYTYVDINLDGRLDIIATGVLSEPRVYINRLNQLNSVTFSLVDNLGNRSAIGTKIILQYAGDKKLQQIKELKLSSGFMSFDNPVLHFGTGAYDEIDRVSLIWPDGTRTELNGPLSANGLYRITRQ